MENINGIIHKELYYDIVGEAMSVYNELGYGFLEKVYENALMLALKQKGIAAKQQAQLPVYFRQLCIGEYTADIIVEDKIIVELKSVENLIETHHAQLLNYLKATGIKLGVLLNFGKKGLQHKRLIK
jgi:GxxExxY protein